MMHGQKNIKSSRRVLRSVVCTTKCDREASIMSRPWPTRSCRAIYKNVSTEGLKYEGLSLSLTTRKQVTLHGSLQ